MWKKATALFGLSALLLVGCNADKDVPPEDETPMEEMNKEDEKLDDEMREDTQDVVPGTEGENKVDPTKEDQNAPTDKDMMEDPNTDEEEILEDDMDARDADDKDK